MGVDDFIPAILWTRYFVADQGYNVKYNRLHRENKSLIILDKNGKASIRKRVKCINIWHLFSTSRVKNG